MFHHRIQWFMIALLLLASLACRAFGEEPEPTLPAVPTTSLGDTTAEATLAVPTTTDPAPAATLPAGTVTLPVGTATLDTGEPRVTARLDLNVRRGPGTQYDIIGLLEEGQSVPIIGVDPATGWWKIACPPDATGNECWVSGAERFSQADNATGVPVAAPPPSPTRPPETPTATATTTITPSPTAAAPTSPMIAYIEGGDVWVRVLGTAGATVTAQEATRLTDHGNVDDLFISPDGRYVAYMGGPADANYLGVARVDGSGAEQLVLSPDLPDPGEDLLSLIGQVQWLADSRTLAFNSFATPVEGPGYIGQEDLWTVTVDGELVQRLQAGQGGGAFAVSADNVVVMSARDEVIRANLDGSEREVVITFPPVNTASEYIYYPQPQWTANGDRALLGITGPDPFNFEGGDPPETTLWEVPRTGPAVELGTLPGSTLFQPVVWSNDGSRLAYVSFIPEEGAVPQLYLGSGAGQDLTAVGPEGQAEFYEWHPNGFNYLYRMEDSGPIVGIVGSTNIETPDPGDQTTTDAQWLNGVNFIFSQGASPMWQIHAGDLSGATTMLFTMANDSPPAFDVWTP